MTVVNIDTSLADTGLNDQASSLIPSAQNHLQALQRGDCRGAEWTGWYDYSSVDGQAALTEVDTFVSNIDVEFDTVVVCGIGGSYLGTRAVADLMSHHFPETQQRPRLVYAGQHLSAAELSELLEFLKSRKPLVNVISKSGTTTETGVAFRVLRKFLLDQFSTEEVRKRLIVTTDPNKGALRAFAEKEGYRCFALPSDVGGRYSVFTPVGLLPLALAEWNVREFAAGASQIFDELKTSTVDKPHPALIYAAWRTAAYGIGKKVEILAYPEPKFASFAEWWKQLFAESDGKNGKGLFPTSLALTTDLHSLGQFVQSGDRSLVETFLQVNQVSSNLKVPVNHGVADELEYLAGRPIDEINKFAGQATKLAHSDGGVPIVTLNVNQCDEAAIGALMSFFMVSCAVGGALLGVNPFDQPGVENYKQNMFALLEKPGYEELAAKLRK